MTESMIDVLKPLVIGAIVSVVLTAIMVSLFSSFIYPVPDLVALMLGGAAAFVGMLFGGAVLKWLIFKWLEFSLFLKKYRRYQK